MTSMRVVRNMYVMTTAMGRVPTGRDRVFCRANVGRWMRAHGAGARDYRHLAELAAHAFGVVEMLRAFDPEDPGELAWVWDVAMMVMGEQGSATFTQGWAEESGAVA